MATSWYEKVREFKSPIHVIGAMLLRSRETQVAEVRRLNQQIAELQSQMEQQQQQLQQERQRIETLTQRTVAAEKERDQASPRPRPQGSRS